MGFMGLSHYLESDGASDFGYTLYQPMLDNSVEELKDEANEYNTPGAINVALLIEANAFDWIEDYRFEDYTDTLFKPLLAKLEKCKKTWGPEHTADIKRMIRSVKKFCKKKNIDI